MFIPNTEFLLRDGRTAVLRGAEETDALKMLEFLWKTSTETPFMGRCADDVSGLTVNDEAAYLKQMAQDPYRVCGICWVEDQIVGSCEVEIMGKKRLSHRATLGLGVIQEYWSLGIGRQMLCEMISIARLQPGLKQVELNYYECNSRARALYEGFGFRTVGIFPDALQLDNGDLLSEYRMVLKL